MRARVRALNHQIFAHFSCIIHLGIFSYVMSLSVEALALWLGISETVAGLTISAAGTSFPNILASMIVARQGLGNMAVGNAFGSNVFNVFIGLGVPWFLYCFLGDEEVHHDTHTYHGLEKEGVLFPTLVLLVLLVMFVILLACTGMKLYKVSSTNVGTYLHEHACQIPNPNHNIPTNCTHSPTPTRSSSSTSPSSCGPLDGSACHLRGFESTECARSTHLCGRRRTARLGVNISVCGRVYIRTDVGIFK